MGIVQPNNTSGDECLTFFVQILFFGKFGRAMLIRCADLKKKQKHLFSLQTQNRDPFQLVSSFKTSGT